MPYDKRTITYHVELYHRTSPVYDDTFLVFGRNKIIYVVIQFTTTNKTPYHTLYNIRTNTHHLELHHRTSPPVYDHTFETDHRNETVHIEIKITSNITTSI